MHGEMGPEVAAFVLAGGKSARMGRDKALLPWRGQTLLERALEATRAVTQDVCIVGSKSKFGAYGNVVEDLVPERGPLGGIHAALRVSDRELNLIVAVDLPFVTRKLFSYLVQRAQRSACLAAVPRLAAGWEPLCAVYRKEFASAAEGALARGQNAVHRLLESYGTGIGAGGGILAIDEQELQGAGFSAQMFRNINTLVDFESYAEETSQQPIPPWP
jgi:molybdenum cofactor guanylyltransferase